MKPNCWERARVSRVVQRGKAWLRCLRRLDARAPFALAACGGRRTRARGEFRRRRRRMPCPSASASHLFDCTAQHPASAGGTQQHIGVSALPPAPVLPQGPRRDRSQLPHALVRARAHAHAYVGRRPSHRASPPPARLRPPSPPGCFRRPRFESAPSIGRPASSSLPGPEGRKAGSQRSGSSPARPLCGCGLNSANSLRAAVSERSDLHSGVRSRREVTQSRAHERARCSRLECARGRSKL